MEDGVTVLRDYQVMQTPDKIFDNIVFIEAAGKEDIPRNS